jgi:hypothetical protein
MPAHIRRQLLTAAQRAELSLLSVQYRTNRQVTPLSAARRRMRPFVTLPFNGSESGRPRVAISTKQNPQNN